MTGIIATRSWRSCSELGPEPIIDLCHFGVPDWLGNFQNPEIADALAEYAGAFAERYPWVRFYTPVNEMYVCARMSALDGLWNEQLHDEGAYARAAWNLANASIAMSDAILKRSPDAIFINSESSEFYQPCCPDPHVQEAAACGQRAPFPAARPHLCAPARQAHAPAAASSKAFPRTTSTGSLGAKCRNARSSASIITSGTSG